METKLLACDLDGTIIFDRAMRPEDRAALLRWHDAGNLLVTATGKSIFGTRSVVDATGVPFDYHVMYSGAVITDGDYHVLLGHGIDHGLFEEVVGPLLHLDHVAVYATTLDNDYELANNMGRISNIIPLFTPLPAEEIADHEFIGIAVFVDDAELLDRLEHDLVARFGEHLDCHRNQNILDLVHRGSSKGSGLKWLCGTHLAGTPLDTYTIGDSWNDISMHEWSRHPVTFDYAPADVQRKCEKVVGHASELVDDVLGTAS